MRRSWFPLVGVLLAFSLVATACGSDNSDDPSPTPEGSGIPDTFPPLTTPTKGGILKMAMEENLDCWSGLSYYTASFSLFFLMARGLYGYPETIESPATDEVYPDLAAELPTVSEDGLTYSVTLREGLTFPDGQPVTAKDVKATFEYMLDPNIQCSSGGPPSSGYYEVIKGYDEFTAALTDDPASKVSLAGVTATSELTTEFRLEKPDGSFLRLLAMAWSFIRPANTPRELLDVPPSYVGPYKIENYTADKSLTVVREPTWAANVAAGVPEGDTDNNIDGAELTIGVPPEIQLAQIKANELDLSFDSAVPSGSDVPAVANDPAYKGRFFSTPDAAVGYGVFRTDKAPFDNIKLREAVNWGIDRKLAVKISGGELVKSEWSEILSKNLMVGPYAETGEVFALDLKKAKALVEESGLPTPIKVSLVHGTADPGPEQAAAIKENLDAIGFDVALIPLSADVYYGYLADPESPYDMAFASWAQDFADAITFYRPLLTCPDGEPVGSNYGRFCSEKFDARVEEIALLPVGSERTAAFSDLSTSTMQDDAPWFPLSNRRVISFVSDRVGNYIYGPNKGFYFGTYFIKDS